MSDSVEGLVLRYRDESDPEPAGVTPGYLVVWDGKPGPAWAGKAAVLTEDDGTQHVVSMGDFEAVAVVADDYDDWDEE